MTMIIIVIGALGMIPKGLVRVGIVGRMETIKTTALLRSAKILKRILET